MDNGIDIVTGQQKQNHLYWGFKLYKFSVN